MKTPVKPASHKPFALVVIALYFFPQLLALLFISAGRPQGMVIALSVSAISFFSIIFFMKLKKWEDEYKRAIFFATSEAVQSPQQDSVSLQELVLLREEKQKCESEKLLLSKQIDEMRIVCEQEVQDKKKRIEKQTEEMKRAEESLLLSLKTCQDELCKKEEELIALKAELLEASLQKKIYEEKIEVLEKEVHNLKFEIKTILKVTAAEK
jgi:hypothetical protein